MQHTAIQQLQYVASITKYHCTCLLDLLYYTPHAHYKTALYPYKDHSRMPVILGSVAHIRPSFILDGTTQNNSIEKIYRHRFHSLIVAKAERKRCMYVVFRCYMCSIVYILLVQKNIHLSLFVQRSTILLCIVC